MILNHSVFMAALELKTLKILTFGFYFRCVAKIEDRRERDRCSFGEESRDLSSTGVGSASGSRKAAKIESVTN